VQYDWGTFLYPPGDHHRTERARKHAGANSQLYLHANGDAQPPSNCDGYPDTYPYADSRPVAVAAVAYAHAAAAISLTLVTAADGHADGDHSAITYCFTDATAFAPGANNNSRQRLGRGRLALCS
jgi:hypothetical protein